MSSQEPDSSPSRKRSLLIWLVAIVVLLVPIPGRGGVWYLNGLLFRIFDFINAKFLPENF